MPVFQHSASFRRLSSQELEAWRDAEAAPVSDCLNRAQAMDAGISPLSPSMHVVGQARTIRCQVGDNSAIHAAINLVEPGDVLVASAGGFPGTAVWGGLMTEAARKRGIAGLVIDGAVRDFTDIVEVGFPCFARGRHASRTAQEFWWRDRRPDCLWWHRRQSGRSGGGRCRRRDHRAAGARG